MEKERLNVLMESRDLMCSMHPECQCPCLVALDLIVLNLLSICVLLGRAQNYSANTIYVHVAGSPVLAAQNLTRVHTMKAMFIYAEKFESVR